MNMIHLLNALNKHEINEDVYKIAPNFKYKQKLLQILNTNKMFLMSYIRSIFCCLLLFCESEAFFKKCHAIYGEDIKLSKGPCMSPLRYDRTDGN